MREKKKFPALPLGLKSEVLETRMKLAGGWAWLGPGLAWLELG